MQYMDMIYPCWIVTKDEITTRLMLLPEAGSQKWKDDPKDGLVIHKCVTQNVTFSWEIEPEEGVIAISWTQIKPEARTNIADYYDGKFSTKKSNLEQVTS